MRLLGEIENSDQTTRFVAWLTTNGVKVKVEPAESGGNGYEVWVKDEDQLEQAKTEFAAFLSDPGDKKYEDAIKTAEVIAREEAMQRKRMQKKIVKVQGGQVVRRPPLTILLIVLCGIVFLMTDLGRPSPDSEVSKALQFVSVDPPLSRQLVTNAGGDVDSLSLRLASIKRGEIWRLVTPIFIHYGAFHILFNMLWLFQFGKMIENRYGTVSLGLMVLAIAAISNFAQCTVPGMVDGHGPRMTASQQLITQLGGMSGVVYGLFGFIWIRSQIDRSSGMFVSQGTVTILMVWLFVCMTPLSSTLTGGGSVANWAHGIGLLVGMAIGYWPAMKT